MQSHGSNAFIGNEEFFGIIASEINISHKLQIIPYNEEFSQEMTCENFCGGVKNGTQFMDLSFK